MVVVQSLPGSQDVVEGVAQLEQLVLVGVETVGCLQLLFVESPETHSVNQQQVAGDGSLEVCLQPNVERILI